MSMASRNGAIAAGEVRVGEALYSIANARVRIVRTHGCQCVVCATCLSWARFPATRLAGIRQRRSSPCRSLQCRHLPPAPRLGSHCRNSLSYKEFQPGIGPALAAIWRITLQIGILHGADANAKRAPRCPDGGPEKEESWPDGAAL
jgi:hypothetical protein